MISTNKNKQGMLSNIEQMIIRYLTVCLTRKRLLKSNVCYRYENKLLENHLYIDTVVGVLVSVRVDKRVHIWTIVNKCFRKT